MRNEFLFLFKEAGKSEELEGRGRTMRRRAVETSLGRKSGKWMIKGKEYIHGEKRKGEGREGGGGGGSDIPEMANLGTGSLYLLTSDQDLIPGN
jgi:hypothetical protein